jgi:hypothetical protein
MGLCFGENRGKYLLQLGLGGRGESQAAPGRGTARDPATDAAARPEEPESAFPLPRKLIISAPKNLLDQVGAGKITFDEFKQAVTVQSI